MLGTVCFEEMLFVSGPDERLSDPDDDLADRLICQSIRDGQSELIPANGLIRIFKE